MREVMAKAIEYSHEASEISTSLDMAALAEKLVSRILTSCTRVTPPIGSEMPVTSAITCPPPLISAEILPYDGREGLNEEQAALAKGKEMIVTSSWSSWRGLGPAMWMVIVTPDH